MARTYASVKLSIWSDDDWLDLSADAKLVYLALLTSPGLSNCGVADWRPAKMAVRTGLSRDRLTAAVDEMIGTRHILVDEESEEVLVRSFVRHDGVMKQPKMATAMATAFADLASAAIRGVVVHELLRLRKDQPNLNGWGSTTANEVLSNRAIDPSTYPLGKGSGKGIEKGIGSGSGKGIGSAMSNPSGKGSGTPAPTPAPHTSHLRAFDEFWEKYPRKVSKGAAKKAWMKAVKSADPQTIIDAAAAQAGQLMAKGDEYCPHASTWLNGERWLDEAPRPTLAVAPNPSYDRPQMPPAPPEVADDPQAYAEYVRDWQRKVASR